MRIPVVFLAICAAACLASCSSRLTKQSDHIVTRIHNGVGYVVWHESGSEKYLIHADTNKRADDVAKEIMGCAHRICVIKPNGVVFMLERLPERQSK